MGWLERVKQTRSDMVAPLQGRVVQKDEQRFGLSQLMELFSYAGVGYSVHGGDNGNGERDTTSFIHHVNSYYKDNGVIFAVVLARMLLFTEARFQWQRVIKGRPGDLFGTQALELLENPWPNGTTGDLLARMEQDASLNGNFYATREKDRIRRLRPDWVEIILDVPPAEAVASNVKGYAYYPGGINARTLPKVYLPHEIAHWAPIPDPLAQYRGMSWLTPIIREMTGDRAASDHKLKFFENAATANLAVSFSENITKDQFNAFMAAMNSAHQGVNNAYKTLYLGGGADVKTIGANMEQMDFKNVQGAGETRICAAGGVPPIIVGLSEGLQSATYSNYGMARRKFGDHWARPQWRSACAALSTLVEVPHNSRLWYDDRDIAFLREDQKDVASIQSQQASTMKQLIDAGFEPGSVTTALLNEDWSLLEHTGLFSVQLQPPGAQQPPAAGQGGGQPPAQPNTPPPNSGGGEQPPGNGELTKDDNAKPDGVIPAAAVTDEQNALAALSGEVASLAGQVKQLLERSTGVAASPPPAPTTINIGSSADLIWSQPETRHFVGGKHPKDEKGRWTEKGLGGLSSGKPLDALSTKLAQGGGVPSSSDLDDKQQKAVYDYTGGRFRDVNEALRTPDTARPYSDTQDIIDRLDSAFADTPPLDGRVTVQRRVRSPQAMFGEVGSRKGDTFVDNGFVSTTSGQPDPFFGEAKVRIRVPKGGKILDVKASSNNPRENELLLPRGTRFKVVDDDVDGRGNRTIVLEVQP